eukprot:361135-Chlamydomonas_euryale.AAC.7
MQQGEGLQMPRCTSVLENVTVTACHNAVLVARWCILFSTQHCYACSPLARPQSLPIVWLDVAVNYLYYGRVYIVLYADKAPLAAENFRQLCTGEAGLVPAGKDNAGNRYHLAVRPWSGRCMGRGHVFAHELEHRCHDAI